ncbi:hypothetical protein [Protaetiibacter intestinalis]|uniref:Uncharacterized protein n=1 Tax=Protaetiibacter intestinalis TaxID=2419774 RepID=A0A387BB86_9MICO|nr:hypothetical protein [Protaetiibacter intestinalis]AYF98375.1 hypothetical protein D7I47_08960 [Protaetiibacter intestinalis]
MKRTGIFALAASCALGVTALVGGVGYASALDVAEQAGTTLDVSGVSTVESSTTEVADSTTLGTEGAEEEPTAEPTDPATEEPSDDDGTADQGSGDVDEVDPSDPVVLPGKDKDHSGKDCGKGWHDGTKDDSAVAGDDTGKWDNWSDKKGEDSTDPATGSGADKDHSWKDGDRSDKGGDRSRSDRGGDRGHSGWGGQGGGRGGGHGGRH